MGLLRSETMCHGTLVVPKDVARDVIYEVGRQGFLMFEESDRRSVRSTYRSAAQRIEEVERMVRALEEEKRIAGACH